MTDTPIDKKLSERFGEAMNDGYEALGDLVADCGDAILAALRLSESHPSTIREAEEREREACAKIADSEARPTAKPYDPYCAAAEAVAIRIRARGGE